MTDHALPNCPDCGHERVRLVGRIPPGYTFAGRVLDEPLGAGEMYRCAACRLGFRWPQPSVDELSDLYQLAESEQWTYDPETRVDWQLAKGLLEELGARSVLDVGCFDGAFLLTLPEDVEKLGVEISAPAAQRAAAAGVTMLGATLDQAPADVRADAVVSFDVVEHVSDPAGLLRSMVARVKPGGVVIVSTGNLDARSWRLMGAAYWYSALPEHLSFTSPAWARHQAEQLGLVVERVIQFSHAARRPLALRLAETAKNMLYRFMPGVVVALRKAGFGEVTLDADGELALTPPIWITAKDQYVTVLRRVG